MDDPGSSRVTTALGPFGVRLYGDDGSWVVCLHGFPDDASTWDRLAAELTDDGFRVAALNLRGYTPSPLDGPLDTASLVADLHAVVEAISPDEPVALIGHDYGAQLAYTALADRPDRFSAAVLFSGAHPAFVARGARRHPRQLWMSRYIVFFQLGALADRAVSRRDFAYVDRLWRRWSAPGFTPPTEHLSHVKRTLAGSMPAPVAMYRAGGFGGDARPIDVPTLYVTGVEDGCALPVLAAGQEELFTAPYCAETWPDVGHFPHHEAPARSRRAVADWLRRFAVPQESTP